MTVPQLTQSDLMDKLSALGAVDEKTRNKVICALIGHSKIQTTFIGYFYCARCGQQVGDALGGAYNPAEAKVVLVGHGCDTCRANYTALSWEHKLFVPDPFTKEA